MQKLTELSTIPSLSTTDLIYVVSSGNSYKTRISSVFDLIEFDSVVTLSPSASTRNVVTATGDIIPFIVRASAGQTANIQEWQNSGENTKARITAAGEFSNPSEGTNSETFGAGATTGGNNTTTIGRNASTTEDGGIAVGYVAVAGLGATALGAAATASTSSIAVGYQSTATYSSSITIGRAATSIAANQFVSGSWSHPINNVYFGKGVADATPTAYTINGTGGSGTNIAGGDLKLAPGLSTGWASDGGVVIQGTSGGSSGSTPKTLVDRMVIRGSSIDIGSNSLILGSAVGSNELRLYRTATKTLTLDDAFGGTATFRLPGGNVNFGTAGIAIPATGSAGAKLVMYGDTFSIGISASTLWYHSLDIHDFYAGTLPGTSAVRARINTNGLQLGTNGLFFGSSVATNDIRIRRTASNILTIDNGLGAAANISCPGSGGAGSETFGSGATAAGVNSTAFGYLASAAANNSTALGRSSSASGSQSVAVGGAAASGSTATALGYGAAASAGGTVAIGYGAATGFSSSIAIGSEATTTADNQLVSGSSARPINNIYFGKGVVHATPTAYTINGTGGSGTNIAGGDLKLAPGISTGNAAPASVVIQSTVAGSSSSTAQTLVDTLKIQNRSLILPGSTSGQATIATTSTGRLTLTPESNTGVAIIGSSLLIDNGKSIQSYDNGGVARNIVYLDASNGYTARNEATSGQAYYGTSNVSNTAGRVYFTVAGAILAAFRTAGFDLGPTALLFGSAVGTTDIRVRRTASNTLTIDNGLGAPANISCPGTGTNSEKFGAGTIAAGTRSTAFGYTAISNFGNSTAIGANAATTDVNQFVAGSDPARMDNVYFGKGVTAVAPTAYTINGTGGSGTDIAGGDLKLAPGKSTGNATPASVIIQSTVAGSSGATAQTLSDTLTVSNGQVSISGTLKAKKVVTSATATATLTTSQDVIFADATSAAIVFTLPTAESGLNLTVKKTDSSANTVTISHGTATIDGASSLVLDTQYECYTIVCDGTNWFII